MTRHRTSVALALLVLATVFATGLAPRARAQDVPPANDDDAAEHAARDGGPGAGDIEDRERVETLVRTLNNPSVLRIPGELRDRIDRLLSSRDPFARRELRRLVRDTGARTIVVERIITSVLVDRAAIDLVEDVVERLRIEQGSSLARSFDEVLLHYADTALVTRLAELASDTTRAVDFRATAAVTLGRTGHAAALSPLLRLWGAPQAELRLAASRAFVHIVPFVTTRAEAQQIVADMREHRLPLAEVLRRRLRAVAAQPVPGNAADFERAYVELARAALPHVPLADVLRLYLGSPVAGLRAAAARRLREFPWDGERDATQSRRAAGKALLRALRREETAGVEGEMLDTLVPLAPALRENVVDAELAALVTRARASGGAPRPVRSAAIRLLGALHDPRPVGALQDEFDALRDTDPELRIELLSALVASGVDMTGWLARRVLDEPDVRVARDMVVKLGQAPRPAAVGVFVQILKDRHPDTRLRSYVVQALVSLWAGSGVVRARDALIDYGLTDPHVAIREVSASGLGNSRPGEQPPVLAALEAVVLRPTEHVKVRVAAARAILDLDDSGALERLRPMLTVGAIWDVYRNRRTEDLRSSHATVEDVLRDADALWETGDPALRERAVQLLQAVVDAGSELWEGQDGRGLVRERLATRLLASGRPADACAIVEGLVAAAPRDGDPTYRWRLLLGRSLRACGSGENLARAAAALTELRDDEALPAPLRPSVLLELGRTELQRGDPTAAVATLAAIGDAAAQLDAEDASLLRELREEAAARSEAERLRVFALVERVGDADAQEELRALGPRAARPLRAALAAEGTTDVARLRQLLLAAAVLARRTFEIPADATPEQVAEIVAAARAGLTAEIDRAAPGSER